MTVTVHGQQVKSVEHKILLCEAGPERATLSRHPGFQATTVTMSWKIV